MDLLRAEVFPLIELIAKNREILGYPGFCITSISNFPVCQKLISKKKKKKIGGLGGVIELSRMNKNLLPNY